MRLFLLSSIFFIFINSCQKENPAEILKAPVVLAGEIEEDFYHVVFDPSIKITGKESSCLFYSGTDSLDLDGDLVYDILFEYEHQHFDFKGECDHHPEDPMFDYFPFAYKNKYVSVINSSFQIAVSSSNLADMLEVGDIIDSKLSWSNGRNLILSTDYYMPPPEDLKGLWLEEEARFLVFRRISNDTVYGWIMMNTSETIEIKEICFEVNK